MKTRTVGKVAFEQVIVSSGDFLDGFGELESLLGLKVEKRSDVSLGKNKNLERPHSPPGAYNHKSIVLPDNSFLLLEFKLNIVAQEMSAAVLISVFAHLYELLARFLGHG